MDELRALLRQATGMAISHQTLDSVIRRRMKALESADFASYVSIALSSQGELEALIDMVVVPETWFFRESEAFAAATAFVLERSAQGKLPVRVLSIPCASGEEPYSLAMALASAGLPQNAARIDALDISPMAIKQARRGFYTRNAFRTGDLGFRDRYFTPHDNGYLLRREIADRVSFAVGNLLSLDDMCVGYDLVFCRNLLIYFDEATQQAACLKLLRALRDDGLLFSGYAESLAFARFGFRISTLPKAFALTKAGAPRAASPLSLRERRTPRRHLASSPAPVAPARVASCVLETAHATPTAPAARERGTDWLLEDARTLADQGQFEQANRRCAAYLERVPDSAEAYFMMGLLNEGMKRPEQAGEYLRRAVYLDPNHYEALCHLALLADQEGDGRTARNLRKRAARVYQRQADAQVRR